jgi:hypothetical protein
MRGVRANEDERKGEQERVGTGAEERAAPRKKEVIKKEIVLADVTPSTRAKKP